MSETSKNSDRHEIDLYEAGYPVIGKDPVYYRKLGRLGDDGNFIDEQGSQIHPRLPRSMVSEALEIFSLDETRPDHVWDAQKEITEDGSLKIGVRAPDRHGRGREASFNLIVPPEKQEQVFCLRSSTDVIESLLGIREAPVVQMHLVVKKKD